MLKDIKADVLKIDMVFLRETENHVRSRIILNSIIDMSKELGMKVLTEGVEKEEQIEALKEIISRSCIKTVSVISSFKLDGLMSYFLIRFVKVL